MSTNGFDPATIRILSEALAATTRSPDDRKKVFDRVSDWDALVDLATHHGVDGVLHYHLSLLGIRLAGPLATRLARAAFFRSVRFRRSFEATELILRELDGAEIRAVPLKGAVLARRIYPDPAMRPSVDVDILISDEDLDRALGVLADLGFSCSDTAERVRLHRRHDYHVTLLSTTLDVMVELHFHAYREAGGLLEASPLLDRSQPFVYDAGASMRVLSAEDEFLFLAAHAAKHFDVSLRLLYDLKLFVEQNPRLDADEVVVRAQRTGTCRALAMTLLDLERFLGVTSLASERRPAFGKRAAVIDLIRGTHEHLRLPKQFHTIMSVVGHALLADSFADMAGSLGRGTARVMRRSLRNRLPQITPRDWDI